MEIPSADPETSGRINCSVSNKGKTSTLVRAMFTFGDSKRDAGNKGCRNQFDRAPRAEKSENWPLGAAPIHRLRWKPYIVDRPEFLSGKFFSFQQVRRKVNQAREDFLAVIHLPFMHLPLDFWYIYP